MSAVLGRVSGALELQNVLDLADHAAEQGLHTAALSARYHAGPVAPSLALSSPLDEERRTDLVMVTAGLLAPL